MAILVAIYGGQFLRIVSLLPSATEIVCALGARSDLVGVSHECDWPGDVVELPVVTRARELGHGSAQIDSRIQESIQAQALSIYEVISERLAELAPDVVITQDLCQVCAVPASAVERALNDIVRHSPVLIRLSPRRLNDVFDDIVDISDAIGRSARGRSLRIELEARLRNLVLSNRAVPKTVLAIEWLEPVMLGGLWTPELIDFAGGISLVAEAGELAPSVDQVALGQLSPDLVLVKPCGYRLSDSQLETELITSIVQPHWPAAENDQIYVVDGNQYFNRSGPRLVDSAELLSTLISGGFEQEWFDRFGADVARYGFELTPAGLRELNLSHAW